MSTAVRVRPLPAAPRRRRPRRLLRRLAAALVSLVVLAFAVLGLGWAATPSVDDAQARVAAVLAAHGAPALSGAVPQKVAGALIATEDSRFSGNPGVDPLSLLKAPADLVRGRGVGGATLEQQLAKNLYESGSEAPAAEIAEFVLALKLDREWSKAQVLRMYLDDGYYGHGFYGLTAAARGYFGTAPAQLTWAQASLLAGLFQAPTAYDPLLHPDAARARQTHVLDRLVAVGTLTRSQADAVLAEPWHLRGSTT